MAAGTALRINDSQRHAPTVVLLHGYMESLDIWEPLAELLRPTFRILTLDLPGHGISQVKAAVHTMEFLADVLHDVLRRQQIERCFVVGHSMGGYVAEAFAQRYIEQLQGIVLLHATPNADTEEKRADRLREMALVQQGKKELIAQLFVPNSFAPSNRDRMHEQIEQMQAQIALTDDEGIVALLGGLIARCDQNDMMRQLNLPELFIFGREDPLIPPEKALLLAEAHPQAEIAWLEHSGHMGHLEEPEQTAQIIQSFVLSHTSNPGSPAEA